MRETLIAEIKSYHPDFSDEALAIGLTAFEPVTFSPKSLVLKPGNICEFLVFAESSITRCFYYDGEGKEQTLWMKPEQTLLTEYKSFVYQTPSEFGLQFYEETQAYLISRNRLMELYREHKDWALFGIAMTEKVHITLIDVFVNLLANDASRNYQYIEYQFPRFLQVAPLKDIASMLQVSQVTLSRIRAGTQTKH